MSEPTAPQTATQNPAQGAVLGGWMCLFLGIGLMTWSLLSFLLYLPLFLASFVLAMVAIAQRRIGHGIPMLLLSVVVPLIFGIGLGVSRIGGAIGPTGSTSPATTASGSGVQAGQKTSPSSISAETSAYIRDQLELYDFEARYLESRLDGRVPGVTFKIRNNGARTLNRVKVIVYFKDADGKTIAEEDYLPVLVTEYSSLSDSKPLRPGYIWQMERGKFYRAKSVPTEWKEGAAEARIIDATLAKSE